MSAADMFTESGEQSTGARTGFVRAGRTEVPVGGWGEEVRKRTLNYPFDAVQARRGGGMSVWTSDNSVMSPGLWNETLAGLLRSCGLGDELPERQLAFLRAMYRAHAVNSASQAVPDRAEFGIEGCATIFNFHADVMAPLGESARRFFRYAADDIRGELKSLFDRKSSLLSGDLETLLSIERRAEERGLDRFPWCAFDAADAMSTLSSTLPERNAVRASKVIVTGGQNPVDPDLGPIASDRAPVRGAQQQKVSTPPSGGWRV